MKTIIVLAASCILFGSCRHYVNNKFKIISFTINENKDSNFFIIKFNVDYYSDSTDMNYFSSSIQKGLTGTNDKILLLGNETISKDSTKCQYYNIYDFIKKFNAGEKEFIGQRLEFPIKICKPVDFSTITFFRLVLYDSIKNKRDTILYQM